MITWNKPGKYHIGSKEGYRISKQFTGEKADYTAWDTQRGNNRQIIKGNCKSLDEAKSLCEMHQMRIDK